MVRSEMSSRSNSARAAKIPKTSFPEAVVVSMAAPWPVRTFSPMPRSVRSWAEPVEFPDDQRVAMAQGFQACGQLGSVILLPRGPVFVHGHRIDPGDDEGVALQVRGLGSVGL